MPNSFTPDDWSRIEAILDDVLDLAPEARAGALDRACGGDAILRAHVERLIAADTDAAMFLETPAMAYAGGLVAAAAAHGASGEREGPGDRIGPYSLVREIGHGGMGRVFLASRADGQFDQLVALKLVRSGPSGGEIHGRFLRERQILARLQHPHIARLLDGGVTSDGRPYFAMEYVAGEPITTYCDRRALDVRRRLALFAAVCEAVHYAHQNLVVHRDLKPSNTLVTPDGQVKLLDFGIAKVLQDDQDGAPDGVDAPLTRLGSGPMTPEYAAPEQVRGEAVTTATDVYALGALAYELLTGRGPHQLSRMTAASVERAVTEGDIARPSSVVSQKVIGPDGVARARGTDRHRLTRELRGDLDTMVMKALHKDPARRYASAGAFVDDIRRYETGLPISARRDSVGYLTGRFVRRHAVAVTATALVLLSLMAGLVGTAWQARVASREAAKAQEVSRFLASLFAVADPALTNAANITALDLLDRGATRIRSELEGLPEVQGDMMLLVGRIYRELGVYDRAQPLLERALELRTLGRGGDVEALAEAKAELARLRQDTGLPEEAEQLHREVLAMRRGGRGSDDPEMGRTLRDLASVLTSRGQHDEAEALQREALALNEARYGAEHAEVASDLEGLQTILRARGRSAEAIPIARRALDMRRKLLGTDHLETATAINNLAILLYERWELPEAERLYRQVLDFDLRRLGELHPNTATVTNNLAFVLRDRGQYEEAERLYRTALDLDIKLFGEEHPYTATVMHNLAVLLAARGRHAEAETLLRDSLAMFRRVYGDEHWRVGTVRGALAGVLSARGDAGAEAMFRASVAHIEKVLSPEHPSLEPVLLGLARHLVRRGNAAAAEPLVQRVLGTRTARLGETDPRTAEARVWLGVCLARLGRSLEAAPLLRSGHERLQNEPHFSDDASEASQLLATLPVSGG
jgi:eukaryotic-like serine/threonine-protein kinase